MVYEKKCSECGKMLDFGGEDDGKLPANAIEFNGDIYCRKCVKDFVEFGTGDVINRLEQMEDALKEIKEELGMEKTLNS